MLNVDENMSEFRDNFEKIENIIAVCRMFTKSSASLPKLSKTDEIMHLSKSIQIRIHLTDSLASCLLLSSPPGPARRGAHLLELEERLGLRRADLGSERSGQAQKEGFRS